VRPASSDRIINQPQQHSLGGPIDTGDNTTAHRQPVFRRSTANSVARLIGEFDDRLGSSIVGV